MAEYISAKEAARRWILSERSVTNLCRSGRIEGAVKNGRDWSIPADAEKPADKRFKTGAYIKGKRASYLPLPVGVSDYRLASTEYYYIDNSDR